MGKGWYEARKLAEGKVWEKKQQEELEERAEGQQSPNKVSLIDFSSPLSDGASPSPGGDSLPTQAELWRPSIAEAAANERQANSR